MKITDYSRSTIGLILGTASNANAIGGVSISGGAVAGSIPVATSSNALAWRDALSFGSNTNDVSSAGTMGSSPSNTRADHVHRGVHAIAVSSNTLYGDVALVAGTGMGITVAGQNVTFDSSGGASISIGSNSTDVSGSTALGGLTTYAPSTHLHRGVHSISHTSNTFYGDVTITASGTLGITSPVSGTFALSAGTGGGGGVADILDLSTAETDDTLVLAPDGAGGVEFREEAGRLIAITSYMGSSGDVTTTTTSTTFVDVDATNMAVTFTAPASGNVIVRVYIPGVANPGSGIFFNLRESTTNVTSHGLAGASSAIVPVAIPFYVTGISAGSHTYKLGWRVDGSTNTMYYGDTARGPVIMEVWAV